MKTKDDTLNFFISGHISLSQYDYRFMSSLKMLMEKHNRITSKQNELFDNLLIKYKKQLIKHIIDYDSVKELSWVAPVVETTIEHTGAYVSLLDNETLQVKVPFNKKFIQVVNGLTNNPFKWKNDLKCYQGKFSTLSLKLIYGLLPDYFPVVKYSADLNDFLNQAEPHKDLIWDPKLIERNGKLIVAAINPILGSLLENVELKKDINTFYKLSCMGIEIDDNLCQHDPSLLFAAKSTIKLEDLNDIEPMLMAANQLDFEHIVVGRGVSGLLINGTTIEKLAIKYNINPQASYNYISSRYSSSKVLMIAGTSQLLINGLDRRIIIKP